MKRGRHNLSEYVRKGAVGVADYNKMWPPRQGKCFVDREAHGVKDYLKPLDTEKT